MFGKIRINIHGLKVLFWLSEFKVLSFPYLIFPIEIIF
jgi:hypothetical protein